MTVTDDLDDQDDEGPVSVACPLTGRSRLLARMCDTCILAPGDRMHLGPERIREFVTTALAARTYVVCHSTIGINVKFGPAICRGFFDAYRHRSVALVILDRHRRFLEVDPPPARAATDGTRQP